MTTAGYQGDSLPRLPHVWKGIDLIRGKLRSDRRDNIDHYRNLTACLTCALKPSCTPDKLKRPKRWEHGDVLDKMQERLDRMPEAMTIRWQTVEHAFANLKAWMGSTHFLTRALEAGSDPRRKEASLPLHRRAHDLHGQTLNGLKRLVRPAGAADDSCKSIAAAKAPEFWRSIRLCRSTVQERS